MKKKKFSLILILGSFFIITACNSSRSTETNIVSIENEDGFNIISKTPKNLNISYVIDTMELQPKILEKFINSSSITPEEKQFILLYKNFITKGTSEYYHNAENGFYQMINGNDKRLKEYGAFGLARMALHLGDMNKLKIQINRIDGFNKKSEWLKVALLELRVSYYYEIADYIKLKKIMDKVDNQQLSNSPILLEAKTWLLLRDNKFNEAEMLLKKASYESLKHIEKVVLYLEFYKGEKAVIDYLSEKKKQYPDSNYIEYLYNFYLMNSKPDTASENLKKLVNQNNIDIFLKIDIAHLLNAFHRNINNELYIQLIENIVFDKVVPAKYIYGNLFYASIYPVYGPAYKNYVSRAEVMNDMNYSLLWQKFSAKDDEDNLNLLKKLEHIDPYYNVILIKLASYYDKHDMNKELSEIKQRFNSSIRYKTKKEIKIMSQY